MSSDNDNAATAGNAGGGSIATTMDMLLADSQEPATIKSLQSEIEQLKRKIAEERSKLCDKTIGQVSLKVQRSFIPILI